MPYETIFAALSNPTRQQIMLTLKDHPRTVREMTDAFDVSQPVVSQHLKILKDAGLVDAKADGTRRIYHVNPHGLLSLRTYLEKHWSALLAGLDEGSTTDDT
jgi:DNA-binding transcriptional ArsR family regulator